MTIPDSFQKKMLNITMFQTESTDSNPFGDTKKIPYHPNTSQLLKAIEEKDLERVQQYLDEGVPVNGSGGAFNETPLHKAAQLSWKDGMKLLLDEGADVYAKNTYDQLPLHYACASKSCKCVRILLEDCWQTTLHHKDIRGHTPLHDASSNGCVKCVSLLLKAGALVDVKDINDETPIHKAAKASSVAAMLTLLNKGADLIGKDKTSESALSYILRFMPGGIDILLDHCLLPNSTKMSFKKLQVNFNYLPVAGISQKSQVKNLRNLVDLGHPKLLLHPLCESYLLLKWMNVRRYFFFEVIFYFTYAILASLVILDKFVPDKGRGYSSLPLRSPFEAIVIIQTTLILLKECLMMVQGISTWIHSVWHMTNSLICILMLIVVPPLPWYPFTHHLASIAILMLWVQCMLHISRFPTCGIYVAMFAKVAKVFLRIFSIFFCLLIAFSLSFLVSKYKCNAEFTDDKCIMTVVDNDYVNNTTPELEASIPPGQKIYENKVYSNVAIAFYKTVTMMIGELDFGDELVDEFSLQPVTSHLIYLAFVFFVSIILSNLLVALAVNDVQGLRNSAYLARVIKQMELVLQMEKTFDTLEATAKFLRFKRFGVRRKKLAHDLVGARITLEPHHPTKGTRIIINDKGDTEEVDIKKALVTNILNCLKEREELAPVDNRPKSLTIRKLSKRPAGAISGGALGTQEILKSVEDFVAVLSLQMNNLTELCSSMDSRLKTVEGALRPPAMRTMSSPIGGSMSSLDNSQLASSRDESEVMRPYNINDAPV